MLTSHELIGFMSPALANDILNFTFESDKPAYKATMAAVAEARKLRPVFLERQPRAARQTMMLAALARPNLEGASAALLRAWLVKKHAALLIDFLDALNIPHDNGVVEDLPGEMSDEKLKPAIEKILEKHPHEVVAVYLNAFNDMNAAHWPNLKTILESDARLQLGAH
jgi:hypothetical protein